MEIEKLLSQIKPILEKNKQIVIQKRKNGEFFNIFSLLGVEWNEVHTHSPFLAELLNPVGSHGSNDTFLKFFIEEMPLNNVKKPSLKTNTAKVKTEIYIGEVDYENETGGEIDILIEFQDPRYAIIIENKIGAGDQKVQLARYHNYAKEHYGNNFTLFYLTLDHHEPTPFSTGKETNKHYWLCISYENEIKEWLKKSLKEQDIPLGVKTIIEQYLLLINKLTNQELDIKMSNDLAELMKDMLDETLAIFDNKKTFDTKIYDIFRKQMEEVAKNTNCTLSWEGEIWDRGTNQFIYFIPKNNSKYKIGLGKDEGSQVVLCLVFANDDKNNKLNDKLNCFDKNPLIGYPFGYEDYKYPIWGSAAIRAICDDSLKEYTQERIKEILADPFFPK